MKKIIFIFSLFCSIQVNCQTIPTNKDSLIKFIGNHGIQKCVLYVDTIWTTKRHDSTDKGAILVQTWKFSIDGQVIRPAVYRYLYTKDTLYFSIKIPTQTILESAYGVQNNADFEKILATLQEKNKVPCSIIDETTR